MGMALLVGNQLALCILYSSSSSLPRRGKKIDAELIVRVFFVLAIKEAYFRSFSGSLAKRVEWVLHDIELSRNPP